MIRFFFAFSRLRWRLIANSLRGGERRDTLERVSRVVALVAPALLLVAIITSVISAVVLGFVAGWLGVTRPQLGTMPILRSLLLAITVLIVLVPMFVGMRGSATRVSRMLLLPISRRTLHFVEVVSSSADPWIAYLLPGLLSFAAGILFASIYGTSRFPIDVYRGTAIVAVVTGVLFVFVLLSLTSLVSFLIAWLVRDRRRSEAFVLVFILAISVGSIVPLLLDADRRNAPTSIGDRDRRTRPELRVSIPHLPAWAGWVPSELYGVAIRNSVPNQNRPFQPPARGNFWLPMLALAAEGAFLYWLSYLVHGRLVESAEVGRTRRRGRLPGEGPMLRVPGFWPGTSAIALAQAYTALRTVRGRLIVVLPGPMIAMFAFLFRRLAHTSQLESLIATHGYVTLGAGLFFGLYASLALTMNQFGSDRAGLTMQFLQPIRDVDVVRGKTAGCAIVFAAGAIITLGCTLIVAPGGSPGYWLATLMGAAAAFLAMSPIASWISAIFPIAADLSKTGTAGNPHSLAMIIGMIAVGLASAPAAFILAFAPASVAPIYMAIWLTLVSASAFPLLGAVAKTVRARKENLVLVAQGK